MSLINEIEEIKAIIDNRTYDNDDEFFSLLSSLKKIADESLNTSLKLDLYSYVKVKESFLLLSQGKYEKVQKLIDENLEYALKYENHNALVSTYNLAALLNYNIADYTKSLRYFNSALEIAEKMNDSLNRCKLLNNIGDLFAKFKEFDTAIIYFIEANNILADKLEDDKYTNLIVINEYNVITTYLELGLFEIAKKHFKTLQTVIKVKKVSSFAVLSSALSIAVNVNITNEIGEVYRQYIKVLNCRNYLTNDSLNLFDGYILAIRSLMKIDLKEEAESLLDSLYVVVKMLNTNRIFLIYYQLVIEFLLKFEQNNQDKINKYYQLFYQTSVRDVAKNDENVANALNVELKLNESRLKHLEMIKKNTELYRLSNTDSLTSLYNRHYLEFELKRIYENENCNIALIIFDIDKFKTINDTFGHVQGDIILKKAANILICDDSNVTVFRYGGDEFVTIIIDKEEAFIEKYIKDIFNKLNEEKNIPLIDKFSFSAGYTIAKTNTANPLEIISQADKALYQAKNEGRNKFKKYNQ